MLFREALERLALGRKFAVRLAAGNGPGVRGAHHDAFEHSLAADEGFFAAFKRWQELDGDQKTP
jgi:hypothetical protein